MVQPGIELSLGCPWPVTSPAPGRQQRAAGSRALAMAMATATAALGSTSASLTAPQQQVAWAAFPFLNH